MTLTKENMKTDPSGNIDDSSALTEDIAIMDESQLERYIRLAFLGQKDPEFLPEHSHFWRAFSLYGGGDRGPLKPGQFFAGIYTTIPHIVAGTYTRHDRTRINVDPEYRTRFERILEKILAECLNYQGQPTERELTLAQGAIAAVGSIIFHESPDSPEEQLVKMIKERQPLPVTEVPQLFQQVIFPEINSKEIYRLAIRLKQDPRYSSLEYHFI